MKAAVLSRFGQAGALQVTDVEKPVPGDGQVLIEVRAAGINPVDTKVRAGTSGMSKRLQLPAILGWDVSGIVASRGKGVTSLKPGDVVFGCTGFPGPGQAYAAFAVADAALLALKPDTITLEEAAGVPMAALTAYQAIYEQLKVRPEQRILIQAAAGGVGHLAVQLAKLEKAYVYGTASGRNEEFVKSLGVDRFIDYTSEKFEETATGLDAVLDAMGGEVLYRSITCVKPGGIVVCLPSSTKDDPVATALAEEHGVKLIWPMMRPDGEQIQLIAALLKQEKLKVWIDYDKVFPLDRIAEAHEAVESHHTRGKVVVKIA